MKQQTTNVLIRVSNAITQVGDEGLRELKPVYAITGITVTVFVGLMVTTWLG